MDITKNTFVVAMASRMFHIYVSCRAEIQADVDVAFSNAIF
jgi:hypothetical protein